MTDMHEGLKSAKSLTEVKQIIGSLLDIQNKMVSCSSADISPHLTDDIPLGNFKADDEVALRWNYILARTALDMGADQAYMNFIHENNEITNITRGRFGFQNKIMRSNITKSDASIKEESGGWSPGRKKSDSTY